MDKYGVTPLYHECYYGHFKVIKILLDNSNENGIDDFEKEHLFVVGLHGLRGRQRYGDFYCLA